MQRFAYPMIFGAVTFIVGVGMTLTWPFHSALTMTFCDMTCHPDRYDDKVVRFPATIYGGYGSLVVADLGCNSQEAMAVVVFDESYKHHPEVQSFLRTLSQYDGDNTCPSVGRVRRKAEVTIVGRFFQHATFEGYDDTLGIVVTGVEVRSPVTVEPKRAW